MALTGAAQNADPVCEKSASHSLFEDLFNRESGKGEAVRYIIYSPEIIEHIVKCLCPGVAISLASCRPTYRYSALFSWLNTGIRRQRKDTSGTHVAKGTFRVVEALLSSQCRVLGTFDR